MVGAVLLLSAAVACSSTDDPFTTGGGYASIQGLVTQASGAPLPQATIQIACADGAVTGAATTDAGGHYLTQLTATAAALDAGGGRLRCRFTEPDTLAPRARADTTLGFARGPELAALQTVDLHESSSPGGGS